ncbi:MAG: 5-formyltetrahydrofolate cyclo-ligase [Beijerinckiaceae bacterium]
MDVIRWRKAKREQLIGERLAIDASTRIDHSKRIAERLDEAIGDLSGITVSAYWPFRGEPDLRSWLEDAQSRGGRAALPVVVAKAALLVFRLWRRGDRLERDAWNMPVPAEGEEVIPDVVIVPVVGFDRAGFRLGYGGGFFDRTLAALPKRRRVIGVGYAQADLATIYPQPHEIPMDLIITEREIIVPNR